MVDMAHFAGLPSPARSLTGDFDPVPHARRSSPRPRKSLRGPRGGMVPDATTRSPPRSTAARWCWAAPLPHVMAAKAVALRGGPAVPTSAKYAQAVVDNARCACRRALIRRGATLVTGGRGPATSNQIDVATSYGS